jgi:hypothetical protein
MKYGETIPVRVEAEENTNSVACAGFPTSLRKRRALTGRETLG